MSTDLDNPKIRRAGYRGWRERTQDRLYVVRVMLDFLLDVVWSWML